MVFLLFSLNDTPSPAIYALSLHDALPIYSSTHSTPTVQAWLAQHPEIQACTVDRKSTRLNSSHITNSYAVLCVKKKRHQLESERQHNLHFVDTPSLHRHRPRNPTAGARAL